MGIYPILNETGKENMRQMLDNAWALIGTSRSGLYVQSSQLFKTSSNPGSPTSQATIWSATRSFLLGMAPMTAAIAFPLEEYHYEYTFDIDPDLFALNLTARTVRVSLQSGGIMRFIYGGVPVNCTFADAGVYTVTFNATWTGITNVNRDSGLPTDRIYLLPTRSVLTETNSLQASTSRESRTQWHPWNNLTGSEFYWNSSGSMQPEPAVRKQVHKTKSTSNTF